MKILITGLSGFVGSHMAEYCLSLGDEVAGTIRWRSQQENVLSFKDKVKLYETDLRDRSAVDQVVRDYRPDRIFHLAAQSFVGSSWSNPSETMNTNILGQLNLFEAVREAKLDARIQIAGSSEEYGLVYPSELPIKETNPLRPLSPYGVSKVAQDFMGYQYNMSYGMFIVRTRAFNHEGPRRGDVFVTSAFAKQIAEMEAGKHGSDLHINVGNLTARRDFTDVRDVVKAYYLSLEKCEPGEVYNICSGKDWNMQAVLDYLLASSTLQEFIVRQDPERMRPSDVPILLGDYGKFTSRTGWNPSIPFTQTLLDTLNYWRERV